MTTSGFPVVPDIEHRMDIVWRQLVDPCDAPITVWIEKLWPALGRLVLEWFAFDLLNMITAYLRPRLVGSRIRSRSHYRRGRKGKRGKFRRVLGEIIDFDPADFVGRHLPGAEEISHRPLAPGVITLWAFEEIIERYLYYYMVLDLTTEFLYNWCSAVAETRYCQARDDAVLWAAFDSFGQTGIFGWTGILYPTTEKERNLLFWNGAGVTQTVGNGVISALCEAHCTDDPAHNAFAAIRVRCLGGPSVGQEDFIVVHATAGEDVTLSCSSQCQPGDLWISEALCSGVWTFKNGHLFLQAPKG